MVTSMITMNNGDNRYCYLVTFNVYQCRAKKKKLSGWAPRCCGYTYSFLATRMTITTRYTTHNIALIYFTLRTSKINKYILSNLKIGEFFFQTFMYILNNLYLKDAQSLGVKLLEEIFDIVKNRRSNDKGWVNEM